MTSFAKGGFAELTAAAAQLAGQYTVMPCFSHYSAMLPIAAFVAEVLPQDWPWRFRGSSSEMETIPPDTPSVRGFVADFVKARVSGDFPDQSRATFIRRNDERIARGSRFGVEISNCAKRKSIDHYVIEHSEAVIYGGIRRLREKARQGVGCATCGGIHCQRTTVHGWFFLVRHSSIMHPGFMPIHSAIL